MSKNKQNHLLCRYNRITIKCHQKKPENKKSLKRFMKKACPEIYSHNIKWNFSSLNKRNNF